MDEGSYFFARNRESFFLSSFEVFLCFWGVFLCLLGGVFALRGGCFGFSPARLRDFFCFFLFLSEGALHRNGEFPLWTRAITKKNLLFFRHIFFCSLLGGLITLIACDAKFVYEDYAVF